MFKDGVSEKVFFLGYISTEEREFGFKVFGKILKKWEDPEKSGQRVTKMDKMRGCDFFVFGVLYPSVSEKNSH